MTTEPAKMNSPPSTVFQLKLSPRNRAAIIIVSATLSLSNDATRDAGPI